LRNTQLARNVRRRHGAARSQQRQFSSSL
jgi:hypothetical protein